MSRNYKIIPDFKFTSGPYKFVPIRDADKFKIMNWRNDQMYHLRQKEKLNRRSQEKYFKEIIDPLFEENLPKQLLFSILKEDNLVAYGGLVHIDWESRVSELSLVMDTELEAMFFEEIWIAFLGFSKHFAFRKLALEKIYTYAFDIRPKLYKPLEQSGFILEARLVHHILINNIYYDVLIHSFINPKKGFSIEKIQSNDKEQLLTWANEANVRKFSIQTDKITKEEHNSWFESKMKNSDCKIYIGRNVLGNNLGQIRLELKKRQWNIDYSVDYSIRGLGIGKMLVKKALERHPNIPLLAIVKKENIASIKIFENLGFKKLEEENQIKFTLNE